MGTADVPAPAGSGKRVLLRSWIGEVGLADSVAWVSVKSGEHDPQRFWVSLADGLRGTLAGSKLVRPLTAAPDLNGWAIMNRLLEDLSSLEDRLWLVIDDLHELRSADALAQLESLVMRAPPELRFVLMAASEGRASPAAALPAAALPQPLTDGETRVLRYLTSHLTAPEIADHLYLSVHTVTTHLRHIYAKLGVHRRREAVDRARALGLLAP